jgi:hypothetical protein
MHVSKVPQPDSCKAANLNCHRDLYFLFHSNVACTTPISGDVTEGAGAV